MMIPVRLILRFRIVLLLYKEYIYAEGASRKINPDTKQPDKSDRPNIMIVEKIVYFRMRILYNAIL